MTNHRPLALEIDLFCDSLSRHQTASGRWDARRLGQRSQGAIQGDSESLDVGGSGR